MKKILKNLGVTLGLVVVLAVGIFLFRDPLIAARLGPPDEFLLEDAPAAPDYADLQFWASHPDIKDTADLTLAANFADPAQAPVDVFYVHPTTYFGPGGWNSTMDVNENAAQTLEVVLGGQGSVFSDCCRFYMPRYREAHIAVFIKPTDPAVLEKELSFKALDLAYSDVERAFDAFLEMRDPERPFILAGHSQGSLHAFRLMETRIDQTPLQDKMIAAYTIGFWFSLDKLQRGPEEIGLCLNADQIGCFVTYDTFGDAGSGRDITGTITNWYKTGWEWTSGDRTLCVNPISWRPDTALAEKSAHKGAMPLQTTFDPLDLLLNRNSGLTYDRLETPLPALTSARCDPNGTLFIQSQTDNVFARGIDERQMYHSHDWTLFYLDIKTNIENRIAKYMQARDSSALRAD